VKDDVEIAAQIVVGFIVALQAPQRTCCFGRDSRAGSKPCMHTYPTSYHNVSQRSYSIFSRAYQRTLRVLKGSVRQESRQGSAALDMLYRLVTCCRASATSGKEKPSRSSEFDARHSLDSWQTPNGRRLTIRHNGHADSRRTIRTNGTRPVEEHKTRVDRPSLGSLAWIPIPHPQV